MAVSGHPQLSILLPHPSLCLLPHLSLSLSLLTAPASETAAAPASAAAAEPAATGSTPVRALVRARDSRLEDGLAEEQELRNQTRQLGVELSAKIVAYRRALGRVVGRRHRDHRALFLTRRTPETSVDIDDSVEVPDTDLEDSILDETGDNLTNETVADTIPPISEGFDEEVPAISA